MLFIYITTAWRNFRKGKLISTINLGGLTLSVTFCVMIFLWVKDERRLDGFHKNASRFYNVYEREFARLVGGWTFAIAGISTLLITLYTISVQVIKSAFSNPVGCLRSE
jgi:hypothetical protein